MDRSYEPTQEEEFAYSQQQQEPDLQQMDSHIKQKQGQAGYIWIKNGDQYELFEQVFPSKRDAQLYAEQNLRGFSYLVFTEEEALRHNQQLYDKYQRTKPIRQTAQNIKQFGDRVDRIIEGKQEYGYNVPGMGRRTFTSGDLGHTAKNLFTRTEPAPKGRKHKSGRINTQMFANTSRRIQQQSRRVQQPRIQPQVQRQQFFFNPSGKPQSQRSSITPPKKQFTFNPKGNSLNLRDRWRMK